MKALGVDVKYYRPPWGHVNLFTLRNLKKYNLKKVIWHVMAEDWEEDTTEEEIQYKLLKESWKGRRHLPSRWEAKRKRQRK